MELAWLVGVSLKYLVVPTLLLFALIVLYVFWFYPKWEEPIGPYKMVGMSTHRVPKSARFKVFYPSNHSVNCNQKYKQPSLYTDWRSLEGMALYTSVPKWMFSFLNMFGCTLPCYVSAPFASRLNHGSTECDEPSILPCVIFSHGLIGNWDLYSQLCIHIASFGIVVMAIEFDDGSASFTISSSNLPLFYEKPYVVDDDTGEKRMLNINASREDCLKFRGPQLRHRVRRTDELIDYISRYRHDIDDNTNHNNTHNSNNPIQDQSLCSILKHVDLKKLFLIGHSFGGCSNVLYVKQKIEDEEDDDDLEEEDDDVSDCNRDQAARVCGVIAYEPWFTPLTDEQLHCKWDIPYLCIIGDRWSAGDLFKFNRLMSESNTIPPSELNSFEFGHGLKHPSFSDVMFWCPDWFGAVLGGHSFGAVLPIHEQSRIIVGRTIDFMIEVIAKKKQEKGNGIEKRASLKSIKYQRSHLRNCWAWPRERPNKFELSEEQSDKHS